MRFAVFGDHPDGLSMACALHESGRHEIAAYCGHASGGDYLRAFAPGVPTYADIEEALADPRIEAVVVASRPTTRAAQLRRALQAERHVLCVLPVDESLEASYEAALLQGDTRHVLLPILVPAIHPAFAQLRAMVEKAPSLIRIDTWRPKSAEHASGPGIFRFDGWDVLRQWRGEIVEVSAFAESEMPLAGEPTITCGRFEGGGLFHVVNQLGAPRDLWTIQTTDGTVELEFPEGYLGPALLRAPSPMNLAVHQLEPFNPGPSLVAAFEKALAGFQSGEKDYLSKVRPNWQDAIRSAELDDAVSRGITRRRSTILEFQEATEEVGFKGTMTLVGCSIIWLVILLAILSRWLPWLGWAILPVLVLFMALQIFRWLVPRKEGGSSRTKP
jgi:predicted dehydrogenase